MTTSITPGKRDGSRLSGPDCRPQAVDRPAPGARARSGRTFRPKAGISLVEVIIALGLSSIVIAGALSSFLFIGRSGARSASYTMQANQANSALETLAQDLRMASGITWNSSSSITLTVPNNYAATGNMVTYAWETNPARTDYHCFYLMPGIVSDANPRKILARDLTTFTFARFDRLDAATASDASTKRVQVSMSSRHTDPTTVATSNPVVSASYIMRNKLAN